MPPLGHAEYDTDPVDVHVGARLRMARLRCGVGQSELGEMIGVSFQQIQKYERAANRISASRLWKAAEVLGVPVAYFFQGLEFEPSDTEIADVAELLHDTDCVRVLSALHELDDTGVRRALSNLLGALADARGAKE